MDKKQCNFCGQTEFVSKKVEYIYRHQGQYMVFRDVPAEVCLHCGMRYYAAEVILSLEARFFEVLQDREQVAQTVTVPVETFVVVP
jgi:YgiT-type zinc finger domain-containing protein